MNRFGLNAAGSLLGRFEPIEVDLLKLVVTQLVEMLEDAGENVPAASTDPAFRRMLPDAYPDDDEASAEFRRFTAGDLLDGKAFNAGVVLATLGAALADPPQADAAHLRHDIDEPAEREAVTLDLDPEAVQSWLRTLTDLRLTLAERLLISPDGTMHLRSDEEPFLRELYEWLGSVQESLVYSIDI
ncbi:hypothetical protein GY21_04945 [Cryobacterium roopkundense]|uniref:Uncharacterized protein n=1 Tax=Cryobacterium roopkundense TaxID=1001240 RepID=A0A099JMX5_9MICO|nr:DUF2017 family protein [Cryobacterium roopkundense]KGJ79516.1 hypothetical protein GY21_04945 [Cryobacterium roopkundense]MBB5640796.1 hypothetical protein [Cryobacterium roopkundense]